MQTEERPVTGTLAWMLLAGSALLGVIEGQDRLEVEPAEMHLAGPARSVQLVVTATSPTGTTVDLTHDHRLRFQCLDPKIVRVDAGGRVESIGRGRTHVS